MTSRLLNQRRRCSCSAHQIAPGVVLRPLSHLAGAISKQYAAALVDLVAEAAGDQHPIRAAAGEPLLAALEGLQIIALYERGGRMSDIDEAHHVGRDFLRRSDQAYRKHFDLGPVDTEGSNHAYRSLGDKNIDAGKYRHAVAAILQN